jgi:hypothetical protein
VTSRDLAEVFEILTTPTGLSSWLGTTVKCQPDVGAKFTTEVDGEISENVFIGLSVPSKVVILSEMYGEISVKLRNVAGRVSIAVQIKRATSDAELDHWSTASNQLFERFERVVLNA